MTKPPHNPPLLLPAPQNAGDKAPNTKPKDRADPGEKKPRKKKLPHETQLGRIQKAKKEREARAKQGMNAEEAVEAIRKSEKASSPSTQKLPWGIKNPLQLGLLSLAGLLIVFIVVWMFAGLILTTKEITYRTASVSEFVQQHARAPVITRVVPETIVVPRTPPATVQTVTEVPRRKYAPAPIWSGEGTKVKTLAPFISLQAGDVIEVPLQYLYRNCYTTVLGNDEWGAPLEDGTLQMIDAYGDPIPAVGYRFSDIMRVLKPATLSYYAVRVGGRGCLRK